MPITAHDIENVLDDCRTARDKADNARAEYNQLKWHDDSWDDDKKRERKKLQGEAFDAMIDAEAEQRKIERRLKYARAARMNAVAADVRRALFDHRDDLEGLPTWYKRTNRTVMSIIDGFVPEDMEASLWHDGINLSFKDYYTYNNIVYCTTSVAPDGHYDSQYDHTWMDPAGRWHDEPALYHGPDSIDRLIELADGAQDMIGKVREARDAYMEQLQRMTEEYRALDVDIAQGIRKEGYVTYC